MNQAAAHPTAKHRPEATPRGASRIAAPDWRAPHVLLSLFLLVLSIVFAVRSGPPIGPVDGSTMLRVGEAQTDAESSREATVFVDEGTVLRSVRTRIAVTGEPSVDAQQVVDALHEALSTSALWPSQWPIPQITVFTLDRSTVAVLDVATPRPPSAGPGVDAERRILASFAATLAENGIDRVAYLRDGEATGTWFDHVAVPATLD